MPWRDVVSPAFKAEITVNSGAFGVLNVVAASILAYTLGRYAKVQDFRFDLLQRASGIYFRALMAAGDYRRAVAALRRVAPEPASAGKDPYANVGERAEALETCLADAAALSYLIERLFSEAVKKQWGSMAINLMKVRHQKDGLTDAEVQHLVDTAHDAWERFADQAATECQFFPLRRWGARFRRVLRPEDEQTEPKTASTGDSTESSPGTRLLRDVRGKLSAGEITDDEAAKELIKALSNGALSAKVLLSGYLDFKKCPDCGAPVKIVNSWDAEVAGGHTIGCTRCSWEQSFEY